MWKSRFGPSDGASSLGTGKVGEGMWPEGPFAGVGPSKCSRSSFADLF